jgi:hypothetical protein
MPTLGRPSAGPEFAGRSKQGDEALAAAQAEFESLWPTMVLMAATIAQRAEENFPSTAYGPYLRERGADPVWAQSMGSLAISLGTRRSKKSRQIGVVVAALRFLAQGKRQRRAILSRATELLAAHDETSILDEIFREAGLNGAELSELVHLLKGAVDGGSLDRDRISNIAAAVVPSLPSARGRKASAASAAHEEFLKFAEIVGHRGYTYSDLEGDFVDDRTKATRFEFDDPHFDPRPAYQRFSAGRRAKAN